MKSILYHCIGILLYLCTVFCRILFSKAIQHNIRGNLLNSNYLYLRKNRDTSHTYFFFNKGLEKVEINCGLHVGWKGYRNNYKSKSTEHFTCRDNTSLFAKHSDIYLILLVELVSI